MPRFRRFLGFAALLLAGALAGCDDSTDPGGGVLPDEQAEAIGNTIADEVDASLNALTVASTIAPLGTTAEPCATASSTADGDGDGVPDDATYSFVAPPCRFSGFRGGRLDIVGQLRVQDPVPQEAGFGYVGSLINLRFTFTRDEDSYTVTRNGTRSLAGSTASLSLSTDLQLLRTFAGMADAAVDQQWTVTFTPAVPLQINQPLPSGVLAVDGTLDWTRGSEHFVLTVTTPTPLRYDAECTVASQRFSEGELRASGTFGDRAGHLRIRWVGCGSTPEILFVAEE